jgi:hypothetical protein
MSGRTWGRIVVFVCSLSAVPIAKAQLEVSGGLLAGACFSQIHGDGVSGFNKLGVSGGPFIQWKEAGATARTQIAMCYAEKGSRKVPNPKAGDYDTWRYRLTYVDIAVMRIWDMPASWWLGVGVQPALLLNAEEDFNGTGFYPVSPPLNALNRWDIGGVLAVGIVSNSAIQIEARLSQSLVPILPRPDSPVARYDNFMMNMAVQLMANWTIGQ